MTSVPPFLFFNMKIPLRSSYQRYNRMNIIPEYPNSLSFPQTQCYCCLYLEPKLSDFLLDLRRSLAHKGFAKILDISTGMHTKGISCGAPAVFANPFASRSQHISSQKNAQLRLKQKKAQLDCSLQSKLRLHFPLWAERKPSLIILNYPNIVRNS